MSKNDFLALGKPMNQPSKSLDTFPAPDHVKEVCFTTDELTSYCPVTEQPDFNSLEISYEPDKLCVESKSLKLYLWTFRDERIFGEGLANQIAIDLFETLQPYKCKVTLRQNIRGGLQMVATALLERQTNE